VALRRVKALLHTRLVPVLSLVAAFSFVVMMFNIPLPGGTTGHAVGVGVAAVLLGPWASIVALSLALGIQALLFGDGGITAIGANCFNIAIVGSLVASAVYRVVGGRAEQLSRRRVVAAGLAGYAGINAAALCTALELGVQPMLSVDATGAPLYCPYPISVAVPAMMAAHLTIAGLAEFFVTAGVVAFVQRSDPALLKGVGRDTRRPLPSAAGWMSLGPFWVALAFLLILSPLGILAAGTAWGEWAPSDFAHRATREQIAAASLNQAPPSQAPRGMARLAAVWAAPLADYAPSWIDNATLGYLLSGMFGTGVLILVRAGAAWWARRRRGSTAGATVP
jgi:cobalt/nickel transport system permease protein